MVTLKTKFAGGLLVALFVLSMLPTASYAYDNYEEWYVDPQNPEVQRIIRDLCKFPLEDNLWANLRILYVSLGMSMFYDYTFEHAWQTIPEMLRQGKGVCCDFARLYYSFLRGIGWPKDRVEVVYGPVYNLLGNYISYHAWVEIKAPSPSGTALVLSANQSIQLLEGEQFTMGFNNTAINVTITNERIDAVRTLGWGSRDGWIPIDPTVVACYGRLASPFLDLFLTFGYHVFLLNGFRVHYNEIWPYYGPYGYCPRRENLGWESLTVTLQPQQSFNISYLHGVENYLTSYVTSSFNSTLPVDFKIEKPISKDLEIIDEAFNVNTYSFNVTFGRRGSGASLWPEDIGCYWFTVSNPQAEPVNVTFGVFVPGGPYIPLGVGRFEAEMYDQYSEAASISVCDEFGNEKNTFVSADDVYVNGGGYPANTEVAIYIIPDGYALTPDNAKTVTYKTTEANGTLTLTLVWAAPLKPGSHDIWVDVNRNHLFDYGDVCNYEAIDISAFHVVPEITTVFSMLVFGVLTVYLAKRHAHMEEEPSFNVKWGRCPRCGVHDILVDVPGLKALCRKCLRKANRILEEASEKALSREDIERIMRDD